MPSPVSNRDQAESNVRQVTAFEWWMRTGGELPSGGELKFNPWHDPEDGRFTFSNQGKFFGSGSSSADARMARRPEPRPAAERPGQAPIARPRRQPVVPDPQVQEREAFKKHVVAFEGDRDDVYLDTEGYPTVGIGHKVLPADKLKVGDRISAAQKEAFFEADSKAALSAAKAQMRLAGIKDDDPFVAPLAAVNFQLGSGWYFDHKKTWDLIKAGNYVAAAREAQNSKWFKDTPVRVRAFQSELLKLEARKPVKR